MLIEYNSPQQFLADNEPFLEKKEIENNLILGLCNAFSDKTQKQEGCVFISAFDDNVLKAASIKTAARAIVASESNEPRLIKELADHYLEKNIDIKGVFGGQAYAETFANFYTDRHVIDMTLIVHELTTINELPLAKGKFEMAENKDIDPVTQWSMTFEEEKDPAVRRSREQVLNATRHKIASGDIFATSPSPNSWTSDLNDQSSGIGALK